MGRRGNQQQQRARGVGNRSSAVAAPAGISSSTGSSGGTGASKGGVEVVSEESFERRKQACSDCQRHRSMGTKSTPATVSTPSPPGHRAPRQRSITVHLRDSSNKRRANNNNGSGGHKQRTASLGSAVSTTTGITAAEEEEEDYHSPPGGSSHRVATLHQLWNNQVAEKYGVTHSPSFLLHSGNKLLSSREEKNFNAFLSAIEKVHLKDHKNVLHSANLNLLGGSSSGSPVSVDEHALLKSVLNNSMLNHFHHRTSHDTPTPPVALDLDNSKATGGKLQLICNDLHNPKSRPDTPDTVSSLDDSSSTSSSAASSDSHEELTDSEDLTKEEVERLAQYTTGCPLTSYSCPPHECPECIRAYYKHYYGSSPSTRTSSSSSFSSLFSSSTSSSNNSSAVASRTQSEAEEEESEDEESKPGVVIEAEPASTDTTQTETSSPSSSPSPSQTIKRVEVSVAACLQYTKSTSKSHGNHNNHLTSRSRHRRHHRSSRGQQSTACPSPPMLLPMVPPHITYYCPDTVSIDLTNTDVEYSVYYHPKSTSSSSSSSSSDSSDSHSLSSSSQSKRHHHHHHHYYHHHQPEYYYSGNFCSSMPPPPLHHPTLWGHPYYMGGLWYPPAQPPLPVAIPRPLCVPRDTKCLKSQCLCLVPAHEIKDFTASQPNQRPWVPLGHHPDGSKHVAVYTVMCYNVLCDKYATRQLYGYCPSWALNWEYRKKAIMEEIRQYNADIISLQEVETEQFFNFFEPELKREGYEGIFSPKSRAHTMSEVDKKHVDGCAIFYRASKFQLLKKHLIEFNKLAMSRADGSHDMINRVMTKDNIALAALLETKDAIWDNGASGLPPESQRRQPVLVATCHVHWDPEYCDVKLIQTMMLMSELKNIIEELQTSLRPGATAPDPRAIPLLLCGDLNSLPDSGVVEYLNTGKVTANHQDFKDLGYEDCLRKFHTSDHDKDYYTHGFNLQAAYSSDIMPYTNYTFDFKGIIDYIFLSRDFMRPLGVLGPLDPEWFRQYKVIGCPHPHIPSDHLPLLVEIEMGLAPAVLNPPRGQNSQNPAAASSTSSSSGLSRSTRS